MGKYTVHIDPEILSLAAAKGYPTDNGDTFEELCGWLREEHRVIVVIGTGFNCDYLYHSTIYNIDDFLSKSKGYQSNSYESVAQNSIKIAIEDYISDES